MASGLDLSLQSNVLTVKLNRPQVLNALNMELLEELHQVISGVKNDPEVSLIIFTGTGKKAFCAGADIAELENLSYFQAKQILEKGQMIFRNIELLGKPTIAAINGYAIGGGLELSLACNLRIASINAKFALPEVKLGMIPGYGGTQRLARLIGKGKALELLLTGRTFTAAEALSLGIVNQSVELQDLMKVTREIADQILENSQIAVSQVLQSVERGLDMTMDQALALETILDSISISSEEQREGVKAFLEKRKPNFRKK